MKCLSCNKEWNFGDAVSQSIQKFCPFCGASLEPKEKPDATTFVGVLRSMVLEYGPTLYASDKFKNLLSDYAAKFPKEKKLVGLAISEEIPRKLLEANEKDDSEKLSVVCKCVWLLQENWAMVEESAENVVNSLAFGLGWKLPEDNSEKSKTKQTVISHNVPKEKEQTKEMKIPGFILVEGGTFQMGSTRGNLDEEPVHNVTVSSFYMCDHEVTQKEYRKIMGNNPSYFHGDSKPVEKVSWYDAVEYCNMLSEKEGLTPCYTINGDSTTCNFNANGYRLPTEAEWEYAARGGKKSKGYTYAGSNKISSVAWYDGNSEDQTHEVKTKYPNELGLYDMSGNVWEWCWDWFGWYSFGSQTNPVGASSVSYRVYRGGSWSSSASNCRVANRINNSPSYSYYTLGFRVVRSAQ